MTSRTEIGTVVEIRGTRILLNLESSMRSYVSSGRDGVSEISQPGDLFVIDAGPELIVSRVEEVFFAEPKNLDKTDKPLRQLSAVAIGRLASTGAKIEFNHQSWKLPSLGAKAYPMSQAEFQAVLTYGGDKESLILGRDAKTEQFDIAVKLDDFLARHVAVLGSTGQGKTNFICQINQEILKTNPRARIIIFDVNGEYKDAFLKVDASGARTKIGDKVRLKITKIGRAPAAHVPTGEDGEMAYLHIPYYALGRAGLNRLLMPSEKTQAPALRFALEHLAYVRSDGARVFPINCPGDPLFLRNDGAPEDGATEAFKAKRLVMDARAADPNVTADSWPSMNAIACLVAEWSCLEQKTTNPDTFKRNPFNYGNVQPMIARIHGLFADGRFRDVIDIRGGTTFAGVAPFNMATATKSLVEHIFGKTEQTADDWNVHIIDLSALTSDLMPFVVSPLLEAFADELFSRGPNKTHPTLLILEEAHHYLRQRAVEESSMSSLAYERLAKEGRKFNLALMLSTQRPSELSPSVLSQCGTWCVMRLTNESDLRTLQSATDSTEKISFSRVSSLMRGYAYVFGSAIRVPQIIKTKLADPEPNSKDASFSATWMDG